MGGVCGIHAESWSVSGFDEDAPGGTERRLAAVIVRRFTPPPADPPLRAALSFIRDVGRPPKLPPRDFHPLPDGRDAASDRGGPREVLFSRVRPVVRVGGQDYPLPEDWSTLVVLMDECAEAHAPTRTHVLRVPAVPKPSLDLRDGKVEVRRRFREIRPGQRPPGASA